MNPEDLINQGNRIISSSNTSFAKVTEALEFLRVYAGETSSFYEQINEFDFRGNQERRWEFAKDCIVAFMDYVQNGLLDGVSIKRQAEIDVVSDFLGQAQNLLAKDDVHSASPTMIIGASLEEFLRNMISESKLSIEGKSGIDSYAKALRKEDLITKQDIKDITSWAGLRNYAAHGKWDEVSDKKRIGMMLEGVNLFMRRYG